MTAEILQEVELPHPVERVWKALTDPRELAQWFGASDIRLEKGARFRILSPPNPHWDGIRRCEVLDVEAPRRLVYSWQMTGHETHRVEWTLRPTASGTALRVRHSGFAPDWALRAMVTRGYEALLAENLPAWLRTGRAQLPPYTPTPEQTGA